MYANLSVVRDEASNLAPPDCEIVTLWTKAVHRSVDTALKAISKSHTRRGWYCECTAGSRNTGRAGNNSVSPHEKDTIFTALQGLPRISMPLAKDNSSANQ